jgi:hypothetical protein
LRGALAAGVAVLAAVVVFELFELVALAFAPLPSPRRGLRTPGRSLGRFPKTPRSPDVGSDSFGSVMGGW